LQDHERGEDEGLIYVNKAIAFFETYPVVLLVIGILILLLFLYKHPKTFIVLAVVAVVIYLVFSLAAVGTKRKTALIKKSAGASDLSRVTYYY